MENMQKQPANNIVYRKFFGVLAISFVIMYFIMFINMDSIFHYHTSLTRVYMALLMVLPMACLMMVSMGKMYYDKRVNIAIIIMSILLFIVVLFALRTQTPVGDIQYMKAMIPHHSSAVMTSKHADIKDPEVRALADSIIASQEREIHQMEAIIQRMSK